MRWLSLKAQSIDAHRKVSHDSTTKTDHAATDTRESATDDAATTRAAAADIK